MAFYTLQTDITPTLIRTISLYGERQRAGSSHEHIFQSCTVAWWAKTHAHTLSLGGCTGRL